MSQPVLKLLVLKTAQVGSLRAFYECLGISFQREKHGNGPTHFAGAAGEAIVEIYPLEGDTSPTASLRIGFKVAQADSVIKSLAALGARVRTPAALGPWGHRMVVEDPDGRPVEIYW